METANIVVIGGGIVGLSVAAKLSGGNEGVYLFEKNRKLGMEVSSHNSGVIHAGFHYPKGSLKAKLCVEGNPMIYEICRKYGISHKMTGKLTVARGESEMAELELLKRQGNENGVHDLRLLDGEEVREMERNVEADMALLSPSSGIVEPDELINHFSGKARNNGTAIVTETEVKGIKSSNMGYDLSGISAGERFSLKARTVINCAGLYSDRIAEMAGLDVDKLHYRLHFCKGDYFRVTGDPLVRIPVYPLPKGAGLGIHTTPDLSGSIKIGPNSYYVSDIDYKVESSEDEFREDVRKYLPSIADRNIHVDSSGIRPKLQGPKDSFRDFIIRDEAENGLPGFVNTIGIESPGLTASPAIAEMISRIYENEIKS